MTNDEMAVEPLSFIDLNLNKQILKALTKSGYTSPTPIQAEIIPHVLEGQDVVGQAQTGTGKTAAFALPLLNKIQTGKKALPQILVLTPTRELALQVAQSFQKYGEFQKNLQVVPIFGGQDYGTQLRQLKRGAQIVVGTPGRIMDHIRRDSLNLTHLHSLVLDEADEMLKMGFLEDVEWILEKTPVEKQTALFSATMPASIRKIAQRYLNNPVETTIKNKTATASTIEQNYLITKNIHNKRDALRLILEAEKSDATLVFVRTKIQTVELAEYLMEAGYLCGALNGDIAQSQRLRMVEQLKSGKLDILVATDVAARGLDVERISHVINFDTPFDTEAYIHRIGRTGRANRAGKAILFLTPREKGMLRSIERATRMKISSMNLPTHKDIQARRIEEYKANITSTLASDCSFFANLIDEYCQENELSLPEVAAALAKMSQGNKSLLPPQREKQQPRRTRKSESHGATGIKGSNGSNGTKDKRTKPRKQREQREQQPPQKSGPPEKGMDRYRIQIGHTHGVKPGNIVGAIANEIDLSSDHIGKISIYDNYSTVDLPYGMPKQVLKILKRAYIFDRKMRMQLDS